MRIVVVGPGALGILFASVLSLRPGQEIWLLDHNEKRAAVLARQGFSLVEGDKTFPLRLNISSDPYRIGSADLILLCVKSPDSAEGIARVLPLVTAHNLLVAMQNGIGHHRILRDGYPGCWAVGVTSQGASLLAPGVVRHGGSGLTSMGFMEGQREDWSLLAGFAAVLNTAGLAAEVSHSISTRIWQKLIVNAGINALTVLLDCANGSLLESAAGRERMGRAVREAALVAAAKGIKLDGDPVAMTEQVCVATAANISSMLQDVRKGRATEIRAINGEVVREAARFNILVPENEKLLAAVLGIEARRQADPDPLD